MTPLDTAITNLLTLKKNKQTLLKQFKQTVGKRKLQQETKTPGKTKQPNDDTPTANTKTLDKLSKTPTPTMLKTITPSKTKTTTKTRTKTNFTNHPDYEYDTIKNKWVKKSGIRPVQLVNRYKVFLMDYLKKNTTLDHKEIEKIVRKHATATNRLKELLVGKGAMTRSEAYRFFKKNSFWGKELCGHMKTICPTETSLIGIPWCKYTEESFFYHNDDKTKYVSCYTIGEIVSVISASLTGGGEHLIILQLPRDPYTRKVFSPEFIKSYIKKLNNLKEDIKDIPYPHVAYFLRNYKKFYSDPNIKPFLNKNILTMEENWKLSKAIENFMTKTDEIEHDVIEEDDTRWWFWKEGKEPIDKMKYIMNN